MHIKKNDTVLVRAGKDRGKKGKVLRIYGADSRAIVEGINFVKKHTRRTREDQQGGIVQRESPAHISNLMVVCPRCNQPSRVGFRNSADGTKNRICRKCGEVI